MTTIRIELAIVADRVASRRDAILAAWRDAIKRDPSLSTGDSLPRAQLYDHIPELIGRYGRDLRRSAGGGVETHEIPGDHVTVLDEPNVRVLAEKLRACLIKAQAAGQR